MINTYCDHSNTFITTELIYELKYVSILAFSFFYHKDNAGCRGGSPIEAFKYLINSTTGGIDTDSAYPYEAKVSTQCYHISRQLLQSC